MLTEPDLARMAMHERALRRMTHKEVAMLLVARGRYDDLDGESISNAERFRPNDGLTKLRVEIIEELTGHRLDGPHWHLVETPVIEPAWAE